MSSRVIVWSVGVYFFISFKSNLSLNFTRPISERSYLSTEKIDLIYSAALAGATNSPSRNLLYNST